MPCDWAYVDDNHVQAGFTRPLTPAEWQVYLNLTDAEKASEQQAVTDYATLADWARTASAQDAANYVTANVFGGNTRAQAEAWIDTNITGTTIAQLRGQVIVALKLIAGAIIDLRDIMSIEAKLIMWLRDLVIRWRK